MAIAIVPAVGISVAYAIHPARDAEDAAQARVELLVNGAAIDLEQPVRNAGTLLARLAVRPARDLSNTAAGSAAFVPKPIDIDDLLRQLDQEPAHAVRS